MTSETSMNREWDPAVAGIAIDNDGVQRMMYDLDELVKLNVDKGVEPSLAAESIKTIFAAARNWPSAPLLFQRMTPAEARVATMKNQTA